MDSRPLPTPALPSEADAAELATLQAELNRLDEALGVLYRKRRPVLERLAELRGPAELPRPRFRTATQMAVASCPRCGGRLVSDEREG